MDDVSKAASKIQGEAIRQKVYFTRRPQTVETTHLIAFYDYVLNNAEALLISILSSKSNIIKGGQ